MFWSCCHHLAPGVHITFLLLNVVLAGCTPNAVALAPQGIRIEKERLADVEYATFVTAGPPRDGLPLLVVLHSMEAGPDEFVALFSRLTVPARVLLPRGTESDRGGYEWWPASAYRSHVSDVRAVNASSAMLARFISAAQRHFRTGAPVVVTGLSQGGDLSFALALRYPGRVRAALPLSARTLFEFWPAEADASASVIDAFHGRADVTASFPEIVRAVEALRARGLPIFLHAYDGLGHDTSPAEERDLLQCVEQRLRANMTPGACSSP